MNHNNQIKFQHALYGTAYVVRNKSFKVSANPPSVNYTLENCNEIRNSGISDAGLKIDIRKLKALGY